MSIKMKENNYLFLDPPSPPPPPKESDVAAAPQSSDCQTDDGEPDNSDTLGPDQCADDAATAEKEPQSQVD